MAGRANITANITCHVLRKQRGTAYVLVLSITSLLVVLGLAATQIARGEIRQGELELEQAQALLSSQSTIDIFHLQYNGETAWRKSVLNGRWYHGGTYQGAALYFAILDPNDTDLADDNSDSFLFYSCAEVGDSRRIYRIEFTSDDAGNLTRKASTFQQVMYDDL